MPIPRTAVPRPDHRAAVRAGADVPAPEPNVVPLPPSPHPVPPAPQTPPEVKDPDLPEEHAPVRDPVPDKGASMQLA